MLPEDEPSEKMYKKEEIELKLGKIDVLEKEIISLKNEINLLNKRITKLQARTEILEGRKWK